MAYQCNSVATASPTTGYAMNFSPAVATVTIIATSEFWVKPTLVTATVPTTPVAAGVVLGFVKLVAGDRITLGVDGGLWQFTSGQVPPAAGAAATNIGIPAGATIVSPGASGNVPDQIAGLQIWCQTAGDLKILAH